MARKPHELGLCLCCSGKPYTDCCELWHRGYGIGRWAPTAEELMRSRYTAYVLKLEDYLLQTWHPGTRPAELGLAKDTQIKWLGLEVWHSERTAEDTAIVEFVARYKTCGKAQQMHEISNFMNIEGKWYYVNAIHND
jgi:SEC-C motif-containing protein